MAGIYIHIPFCKQACTYCNFHFSTSLEKKQVFLQALENEMTAPSDFIPIQKPIETIYFGGGTPSLLTIAELESILNTIQKKFPVSADAEITLEANPDDISKLMVKEWMKAGINRLSVGIQSFDEEELRWMNRAHDAQQSIDCIRAIREAGMYNFSADLIFGGPLLDNDMLERNIGILTGNDVPHISAYALTIEAKTPLHRLIELNKTPAVDAGKQAEHFTMTMRLLASAGYEHYEISNYAKPGMRSRHNSSYWQGKPYLGFGPSSHSYNGNRIRRWNLSNNSLYISNWLKNTPVFEEETLTEIQQLNEYIMISLRTCEGLSTAFVSNRFGAALLQKLSSASQRYLKDGLLEMREDHLLLTDKGKLLADGISAGLFAE